MTLTPENNPKAGVAPGASRLGALEKSELGLKPFARGKVRDIYDLGERLLIVATDRISAFDHILPTLIPGKGRLLTQLSVFWFHRTTDIAPNHLISAELKEILPKLPKEARLEPKDYEGRVMLVKKARRVDAECVVRGYLAGSGWKEYLKTGAVCGRKLPKGLKEADKLPEPIFTPATKADEGHDENISKERLASLAGRETADRLEELSLALYAYASEHAEVRGLILADTKFEFGFIAGKLCVIDELLTPDSSRFWDKKAYKPGRSPENFDKQFVRDYLERIGWDKNLPVPALPSEVVAGTAERYQEAFRRLTG